MRIHRLTSLVSAGIVAVAAELTGIGLLGAATWLLYRAAERPALAALSLVIVAVRALALGRGTLRYMERLRSHDVALRAVTRLREQVFRGCVERGVNLPHGDLLSRLVSDVEASQDLLVRCLLPVITAVGAGTTIAVVIAVVDPFAGLAASAAVLASWTVPPLSALAVDHRAAARLARRRAELSASIADRLYGAADLTAVGAWSWLRSRNPLSTYRVDAGSTGPAALVLLLQAAAVLGVQATTTTRGPVAAALAMAAFGAVGCALPLVEAATCWRRSMRSLRRVATVVSSESPRPRELPRPPMRQSVRSLRLRGVDVGYGPRTVLHNIDLDLRPGERVAVTGASGAGKTTLLRLVAGQLTPTAGLMVADGRPVEAVDLAANCRGVLSDSHVFHHTVRANLLIASPDADDSTVSAALRSAGLGSWLRTLPSGLDTMVGDDGNRLSGGQRQRLLLARALLSEAPLLVLDEPTDGLDPATADLLLANIIAGAPDRALLIAAHDPAPDLFDRIITLDAGRIFSTAL